MTRFGSGFQRPGLARSIPDPYPRGPKASKILPFHASWHRANEFDRTLPVIGEIFRETQL
jgi:hypothetical protein